MKERDRERKKERYRVRKEGKLGRKDRLKEKERERLKNREWKVKIWKEKKNGRELIENERKDWRREIE